MNHIRLFLEFQKMLNVNSRAKGFLSSFKVNVAYLGLFTLNGLCLFNFPI